jgi:predicted DsbA family dithiol-disulfide isomerase
VIVTLAILELVVASCGASLPSSVREEMARTPRGTATVVFFTDFQCPFCRRTHAALAPVVGARKGRVRVVLLHVPLRQHPFAQDAARASICAEQLGAREGFDDAMFAASDLSPPALEELASQYGVDRDALRRCTSAPETDARIKRDTAAFVDAGGEGVPLLYVGTQRLDGAQPGDVLEEAVEDALAAQR